MSFDVCICREIRGRTNNLQTDNQTKCLLRLLFCISCVSFRHQYVRITRRHLSSLCLATLVAVDVAAATATTCESTTSLLALKAAATATLASSPAIGTTAVSTATTTASCKTTANIASANASLFDSNLLGSDLVGVGCNSSVVCGLVGEVDKSAVL